MYTTNKIISRIIVIILYVVKKYIENNVLDNIMNMS